MLPAKLKALRRALSKTVPPGGRATLESASARRSSELLERTRAAELDAAEARVTPAEFRKWYGYAPSDAPRMRQAAELLAYGSGGNGERHGLDARS